MALAQFGDLRREVAAEQVGVAPVELWCAAGRDVLGDRVEFERNFGVGTVDVVWPVARKDVVRAAA